MEDISKTNKKICLGDLSKLIIYTKKDVLKTEYQRNYRIKKYLINHPLQEFVCRYCDKNHVAIYYLKNNKLQCDIKFIKIDQ